jgi:hypothetical protein
VCSRRAPATTGGPTSTRWRQGGDTPPPDANPDAAVELTKQTDPDVPPLSRRLLRSIAHATRWRAEYRTARDGTAPAAGSGVDLDPANPAA